jgi:hypothetical protein
MKSEDVAQKKISKAIRNVQKNPLQVKGWMWRRRRLPCGVYYI